MNLDRKTKRIIILVIAGVFILFGIAATYFKLKIDPRVLSYSSFALFIFCAYLLFSKDRKPEDKDNNKDL